MPDLRVVRHIPAGRKGASARQDSSSELLLDRHRPGARLARGAIHMAYRVRVVHLGTEVVLVEEVQHFESQSPTAVVRILIPGNTRVGERVTLDVVVGVERRDRTTT